MFSLYCYQETATNQWELKGYMPVNYRRLLHRKNQEFLTNQSDTTGSISANSEKLKSPALSTFTEEDNLKFAADGDYLNVLFQGSLVFTLNNKAWLAPMTNTDFLISTLELNSTRQP